MELIDIIPEFNLYEEFWKIYTKGDIIRPQYVSGDAVVDRCIIGEGAEIYGEVHNSVIGADVRIAGTIPETDNNVRPPSEHLVCPPASILPHNPCPH